jgi:RNA polymerase sigma factor (sigma-70 family)
MAPMGSLPHAWTVGDLGAFYTQHRTELLAHARRVLKDQIKAEEITQDALIKFMLAAPDLESDEHALSYLHRTIENLCIDFFRAEGRRPNLVVIDDAKAEVEAAWQNNADHSAAMTAAEDAAIIRQALALLSPAERAALVMWEMEGRSTAEIAVTLGIKESSVRHTVSRARTSMRKILATLVVNHQTGLTALDALSTTYKKAAVLAEKSSKTALSLLLIVTTIFGYNTLAGKEIVVNSAITEASVIVESSPSSSPKPASKSIAPVKTKKAASFFGLDKKGVPTNFSVTNAESVTGKARVSKGYSTISAKGMVMSNHFITGSIGPNILIDQEINLDATNHNYTVKSVNVGFGGNWSSVEVNGVESIVEQLANGQYLLSATIQIGYLNPITLTIPTGDRGYDLDDAPQSITTLILLSAGKSQILAQATQVIDK